MPWRGPEVAGEYPTLGYLVADWIEEWCIVPDGDAMGQPFRLTDEQLRFVLRFYRLHPKASTARGALAYYGGQLMRSQKWGKDPLAAVLAVAEGLGPVVFDGWDAAGDPVGRPRLTALIQCAAISEEQTDNTFRPIYRQFFQGPLGGWPGVDPGVTRVGLPNDGMIEPVTSTMSRLGAPINFATFTESHLMTASSGGLAMARAMKRNLAGMDGRWIEVTNCYDPAERSVAQLTAERKAPGVVVDYRPPRTHVDLDDRAAVKAELEYVYGDSMLSRGGWVRVERILAEMSDCLSDNERRRFFLNEITSGEEDYVDPVRFAAAARDDGALAPGELIAVGFDGSRSRDWTVVVISRLRDGRLFLGGAWQPIESPDGDGDPKIDRVAVDERMRAIFAAYKVKGWHGDPYKWQDYIDAWHASFGDVVLEFPTNAEQRMDKAIERFQTAFRDGEITHDGSELLVTHLSNTVIVKGRRRSAHDGDDPTKTHYLKLARRKSTVFIDVAIAATLAHTARAWAIERGALQDAARSPQIFIFGDDETPKPPEDADEPYYLPGPISKTRSADRDE